MGYFDGMELYKSKEEYCNIHKIKYTKKDMLYDIKHELEDLNNLDRIRNALESIEVSLGKIADLLEEKFEEKE